MTGPIALPTVRSVKDDKPHLIDWGGQLRPPLGGPVQTIDRLGTRFALDVTVPLQYAEPDGRIWSARLMQAKLYGALFAFGQDGLDIGAPGSPVVNGDTSGGTTLYLRSATPGYVFREGQFLSLVQGRRYLHNVTADTVVAGDGTVTLPILPMLRIGFSDGNLAEVAAPKIQGSLSGNDLSWSRPDGGWFDFGTITITEDE